MATVNAPRDGNDVPAALFLVSGSNREVAPGQINSSGRVLVDSAIASGTVTSVSVVTANGLAGSVANPTTTPAITLSTTISGLLKGNGTAISAAVSNSDYQAPITLTTTGTSGAATFDGTTLNVPTYGSGTGNVVGPASATDKGIARFNTTTGKLIQNSAVTIADTTGIIAGTQGVIFSGSTSGTTTLNPTAIAGSTTLTLPAATDTLIGKATTDTLTNKTYDTAGTGNSFSINGLAATANTGTGAVVRATSPALVTPVLGTPSSGTLTSCTGLPVSTGISGLGTGVATFLATPSSANLIAAVTDETGTGALVFGTSPVFTTGITTPAVTAAANTSINMNAGSYNTIQTYTPSAAGTATLDLSKGNIHHITMPAGNITIALSNGTAGQCFIIRILQDGTGSRTVTWFTTIKWAGGSTPTLTTTASKADTLGFEITGSNTYDGFVVGQNI